MKTFTATNSDGLDIFHIIGNKDLYTITETNGKITYTSEALGRTYVVTGSELLDFKSVNSAGKKLFTWDNEITPFSSRASCLDWYNEGNTTDGFYKIKPADTEINAYCDMSTGGWTRLAVLPNQAPLTESHLDVGITFTEFKAASGSNNPSSTATFSTPQNAVTGLFADSNNGKRVMLGETGGYGIYNTSQNRCNWSNGYGMIGAGYDGSCGDSLNDLRVGTCTNTDPYLDSKFTVYLYVR